MNFLPVLVLLTTVLASTFPRISSYDSYGLNRILRLIKDPEISSWQLREFLSTAAAYSSTRVAKEIMACPNFKPTLDYSTVIMASANNCNTTATEFFLENIPSLRGEKSWYLMKKSGHHCDDSYKVEFINKMKEKYGPKIDAQ